MNFTPLILTLDPPQRTKTSKLKRKIKFLMAKGYRKCNHCGAKCERRLYHIHICLGKKKLKMKEKLQNYFIRNQCLFLKNQFLLPYYYLIHLQLHLHLHFHIQGFV